MLKILLFLLLILVYLSCAGSNTTYQNYLSSGTTSYSQCVSMEDVVSKGPVLGTVIRMPFLLSGYWKESLPLYISITIVSVFCVAWSLSNTAILFSLIVKEYPNIDATDILTWLFNWSNTIILVLLVQVGWNIFTFPIATIHNCIELHISLIQISEMAISCTGKKLLIDRIKRYVYVFAFTLEALFVIPHVFIPNYQIAMYISSAGAIGDLALLCTCVAGVIYTIVHSIRAYLKHDVFWISERHLVLLVNMISHSGTVVLLFISCPFLYAQLVMIFGGTILMNFIGALYFVLLARKAYRHKEFYLS